MEREAMEFDVVIVGAGPAGLAAAVRLAQLSREHSHPLDICVVEKGSDVGAHLLSGAVLDPRALDELLPDWQERDAPLVTRAGPEKLLYLTARRSYRLPTPSVMRNEGCYVTSLGRFSHWLAKEAEALGVEIFPGFAAAEVLYGETGEVQGVVTGDMGLDRTGRPTPAWQPGVELRARQTIFAEGCRGSLSREVMERFGLRRNCNPQTYGLGIKELWEIEPEKPGSTVGATLHTVGWPLDHCTYGGGFLYRLEAGLAAVGFVIGLDYRNPLLDPFQEFQRFKSHPAIRPLLEGSRPVGYGARVLSEGGLQSVPELAFPGGLLVGDAAGFLDVPRIKGIHTAMKSGMVAAEALHRHFTRGSDGNTVHSYPERLRQSWVWEDLHRSRNVRPGFRRGLWPGLANAALESWLLRGRSPWTLRHHVSDREGLGRAEDFPPIDYPPPDGAVTFDRATSLRLANLTWREGQPVHLRLDDPELPVRVSLPRYGAPEQRYCPAGVYEIIADKEGRPRLWVNAGNCLHCKACDIKDPFGNIRWTPPEGGSGPNYTNM